MKTINEKEQYKVLRIAVTIFYLLTIIAGVLLWLN